MITVLTEQERRVKSVCRAWAATATRDAREESKLSAEDFGELSGVGESRQLAFERPDEGKRENPRVQLDKLVRWPFASLLALCRSLLGTRAVIVEVTAQPITLNNAGRALTKESSEAVLASLETLTPEKLADLEREAMELAQVAMGVAIAARAERERVTPKRPLRAVEGR